MQDAHTHIVPTDRDERQCCFYHLCHLYMIEGHMQCSVHGLVELIFEAGCCLQNPMLTELLAMMSESGAVYKTVQVSALNPVEHQT